MDHTPYIEEFCYCPGISDWGQTRSGSNGMNLPPPPQFILQGPPTLDVFDEVPRTGGGSPGNSAEGGGGGGGGATEHV